MRRLTGRGVRVHLFGNATAEECYASINRLGEGHAARGFQPIEAWRSKGPKIGDVRAEHATRSSGVGVAAPGSSGAVLYG